jgi:putative phage-type endonuclease
MALTIQQRKDRRLGIGGSDIAAIVGINKWSTPLDVYLEKISTEEPYEEEVQLIGANPIEWGNIMESVLVKHFERTTNSTCETQLETFVHPEYPYMRANVDAKIVGEDALLECKTAGQFMAKQWSDLGGDNIPEPYLLQCAYYAEVANVSKVYIAVLIGGNDFRIYNYDRNATLGNLVLSKVKDFWENHVLKQIPPEAINLEDSVKLWKYTTGEDAKCVTPEIELILKDMRALKAQQKAIEKIYAEKQLQVCNFLEQDIAINDEQGQTLLTWKPQVTNRFDGARFKAEHPEMYANYMKASQTRIFKLKGEIE